MDDSQWCWICYDDTEPLEFVCKCPRLVHKSCLGRWQVNNIGNKEENTCRFCQQEFPDWRDSLMSMHLKRITHVVMRVSWGEVVHDITVKIDDYKDFEKQARVLFDIPHDQAFDMSYTCQVPGQESEVVLDGFEIDAEVERKHLFDTAIHLAACAK